jgi:hypothetical protein
MKIPFACPSCSAGGSIEAAFVGRSARCKKCGHEFKIRGPNDQTPDVYGLKEPATPSFGPAPAGDFQQATFVPAAGRESREMPEGPRFKHPAPRRRRGEERGFPWLKWLGRAAIALVIVLGLIAQFVPNGIVIAGSVLMALGSIMVLVGYCAGLYGAFCEDFLHGAAYFAFPLYTAYYVVTRWDDMWIWFACSTTGAVLASLGAAIAQAGGAGS